MTQLFFSMKKCAKDAQGPEIFLRCTYPNLIIQWFSLGGMLLPNVPDGAQHCSIFPASEGVTPVVCHLNFVIIEACAQRA